jgi:hypothetical protein
VVDFNIFFSEIRRKNRKYQKLSTLYVWYQWEGEDLWKGFRGVNMVEILCTYE